MSPRRKELLRALEDSVEELWGFAAVLAVALVAISVTFFATTMIERHAEATFAAAAAQLQAVEVRP